MNTEVILASNNAGKLRELRGLLAELGLDLISQGELGVSAVAETGSTFVDNALLKARHAARESGRAALADDSGLEVDWLQGAPGVHSARFAGEGADDARNNQKLLALLRDVPAAQRGARFRCVLVYLESAADPAPLICEGVWEGRILERPHGAHGFGYDPLFLIPELGRTAAELTAAEKNALSHRGRALRALLPKLRARIAAQC
ncbi:MAG: RdgB/HAM1 family non-canonical purine NTP pyrophosphatase [Gammaproteobacteria bacterium]|nr:RdgB/HAM1 family non-canonical purine NTP pyrophosphatase [Gammaproteobacteria bacterium]